MATIGLPLSLVRSFSPCETLCSTENPVSSRLRLQIEDVKRILFSSFSVVQ